MERAAKPNDRGDLGAAQVRRIAPTRAIIRPIPFGFVRLRQQPSTPAPIRQLGRFGRRAETGQRNPDRADMCLGSGVLREPQRAFQENLRRVWEYGVGKGRQA